MVLIEVVTADERKFQIDFDEHGQLGWSFKIKLFAANFALVGKNSGTSFFSNETYLI